MTKIFNLGLAVVGVSLATFASSNVMNANSRVVSLPCYETGKDVCSYRTFPGVPSVEILRWGTIKMLEPITPLPPLVPGAPTGPYTPHIPFDTDRSYHLNDMNESNTIFSVTP